jgi:hypothetical protein
MTKDNTITTATGFTLAVDVSPVGKVGLTITGPLDARPIARLLLTADEAFKLAQTVAGGAHVAHLGPVGVLAAMANREKEHER